MRDARRSPLLAGQLRAALEVYRASLLRGETPDLSPEVFAALTIEGLGHGHNLVFADEVKRKK